MGIEESRMDREEREGGLSECKNKSLSLGQELETPGSVYCISP
jgi:hypothetical protein